MLIDGDHTYDGVTADFRDYSHLVRDGGLIAFHDIAADEHVTRETFGYAFGVGRFWREVSGRYQRWEFVDEECWRHRRGGGIGVLRITRR
jgi:hypothetical protein